MVKEIPLQNGMVALVDDEDYERCTEHIWSVRTNRESKLVVSSNSAIPKTLGAFIFQNTDEKKVVFQKNMNRQLDFTKENLTLGSLIEIASRGRGRGGTSKYKGVYWNRGTNSWRSRFTHNGKNYEVGLFQTEDDAAKAYNDKVKEVKGDKAYINIIGENNNVEEIKVEKQNQLRRHKGVTGFIGVACVAKSKKFQASIVHNKKRIHLGTYHTKEEAAKSYDQKAYELHGDKAILNFPELIDEYKKALKEVKPITIKPVPVALVSQAINKAISARQK